MGKVGNLRRLLAVGALRRRPSSSPRCPEQHPARMRRSRPSTSARTTSRRAPRPMSGQLDQRHPQREQLALRGGRRHPAARVPRPSEERPDHRRTVEITYLTRKGGVHAYDSLATWNHTQSTADRCADINAADCVPGAAITFPIPLDPTVVADANGAGSATSGHQLARPGLHDVRRHDHRGLVVHARRRGGSSDSYAHVTLTYSVPVDSPTRQGHAPLRRPPRPEPRPARLGCRRRRRLDQRRPVPHPHHCGGRCLCRQPRQPDHVRRDPGACATSSSRRSRSAATPRSTTRRPAASRPPSRSRRRAAREGCLHEHHARRLHRYRVRASGRLGLHEPRLPGRGQRHDRERPDPTSTSIRARRSSARTRTRSAGRSS